MGAITQREDDFLAKATAAAIAAAKKPLGPGAISNIACGRLSDAEWGWIVTGAIFGWVEARVQHAINAGRDSESTVRVTGFTPDPADTAVVKSILPTLADQAAVDWSQPLSAWSSDMMTDFLMKAWRLIVAAETVRDHGPGTILKKAEFDEKTGDAISF